jgi:hypothetical protein
MSLIKRFFAKHFLTTETMAGQCSMRPELARAEVNLRWPILPHLP